MGGGFLRLLASASPKVLAGLGIAGGGIGLGATADITANGSNGYVGDFIEWVNRAPGEAAARANAAIKFEGFFAILEQIGAFVMKITGGAYGSPLVKWARGAQVGDEGGLGDAGTDATAPALTETGTPITAANTFTKDNLVNGITDGFTVGDVAHKVGLVAAGAADETVDVVASAAGHIADFGDWLSGGVLEAVVGIDTGYKNRDLSSNFSRFADTNMNINPTLATAWDRAAYGAGGIGAYFIPYAGMGKVAATAVSLGAGAVSAFTPDQPK